MCGCETTSTSTAVPPAATGREYRVAGMSCQPCAGKVGDAVRVVPGVTGVSVDLPGGRMTVAGTATDSAIHAAVTDAGYRITNL